MFKDKTILIIGGTGTIGSALTKKLISYNPKVLRIFSRDEFKQFEMQNELKEHKNIRFLLGDVRDRERLDRAMNEVDIVFDLAALKHVPACEYDPFEAVKTNVIGTQNLIECALENKVKKVIYTSSDKAISPTNTMGATKLLAERLISSADYTKGKSKTVFAAVRFGNVMGSRGSVIPLWQKQIREESRITITDPNMTRFMMSINQSVNLVLKACETATGGEIFVLKMPVIKLRDMAEVVIENACTTLNINKNNIGIEKIGLRIGEKIFEELMTEYESSMAIEYDDMFAVLPYHRMKNICIEKKQCLAKIGNYSSQEYSPIEKEEIKALLKETLL